MFGIDMPELFVIFVLALIVFGPKELPRIARTLGRAMAELRRASDALTRTIRTQVAALEQEEAVPPPAAPPPLEPAAPAAETADLQHVRPEGTRPPPETPPILERVEVSPPVKVGRPPA